MMQWLGLWIHFQVSCTHRGGIVMKNRVLKRVVSFGLAMSIGLSNPVGSLIVSATPGSYVEVISKSNGSIANITALEKLAEEMSAIKKQIGKSDSSRKRVLQQTLFVASWNEAISKGKTTVPDILDWIVKKKKSKFTDKNIGIMKDLSEEYRKAIEEAATVSENSSDSSNSTDTTSTSDSSSTTEKESESSDLTSSSDFVVATTDSAGRRSGMIQMAAGKQNASSLENVSGLTEAEIRFLGVYLSNFYAPFYTELGVGKADREKEIYEQNVGDMKNALTQNLHYSDDVAEVLTKSIIGLVRSNSSELVLAVSQQRDNKDSLKNTLIEIPEYHANYYTFWVMMSGKGYTLFLGDQNGEESTGRSSDETPIYDGQDILVWLEKGLLNSVVTNSGEYDDENDEAKEEAKYDDVDEGNEVQGVDTAIPDLTVFKKISDDYESRSKREYNYIYLAYKDGKGNLHPVFDASLYGNEYTPSMMAFYKCLESSNAYKGYGTNLLDLSAEEAKDNSLTAYKDLVSSTTDSLMYRMTIYGTKMYVDCFGDIIAMGGNHQYIVIPAAMNPYIWRAVDEAGNELIEKPLGSIYNMINMQSLSLYESGNLFEGNLKEKRVSAHVIEKYKLVDSKSKTVTSSSSSTSESETEVSGTIGELGRGVSDEEVDYSDYNMDYYNGDQSSDIDPTDVASIIASASGWAKEVANNNTHGYSNDNDERFFQNGEISSTGIVVNAYNQAGIPILDDWWKTGHKGMIVAGSGKETDATLELPNLLLKYGFTDVTDEVDFVSGEGLEIGDVAMRDGFSAIVVSRDGSIVQACYDYDGKQGDSSGNEVSIVDGYSQNFSLVYRFVGYDRFGKKEETEDTKEAQSAAIAKKARNWAKSFNASDVFVENDSSSNDPKKSFGQGVDGKTWYSSYGFIVMAYYNQGVSLFSNGVFDESNPGDIAKNYTKFKNVLSSSNLFSQVKVGSKTKIGDGGITSSNLKVGDILLKSEAPALLYSSKNKGIGLWGGNQEKASIETISDLSGYTVWRYGGGKEGVTVDSNTDETVLSDTNTSSSSTSKNKNSKINMFNKKTEEGSGVEKLVNVSYMSGRPSTDNKPNSSLISLWLDGNGNSNGQYNFCETRVMRGTTSGNEESTWKQVFKDNALVNFVSHAINGITVVEGFDFLPLYFYTTTGWNSGSGRGDLDRDLTYKYRLCGWSGLRHDREDSYEFGGNKSEISVDTRRSLIFLSIKKGDSKNKGQKLKDLESVWLSGGLTEYSLKLNRVAKGNSLQEAGSYINSPASLPMPYIKVDSGNYKYNFSKNNVLTFDGMIFVDDLGAFHFDSSDDDIEWSAINVLHYVNSLSKDNNFNVNNSASDSFGSIYGQLESGAIVLPSVSEQASVAVFLTYIYAGLYDEGNMSIVGALGYKMDFSNLPSVSNKPLDLGDDLLSDLMDNTIKEWIYYLLHPTEGLNYFRVLFKNKIGSFLLGWHNDMLGTYGVGATTGVTKYRNTTGYLTTPDLSEIEWTANIIDLFKKVMPYIAIVSLVFMVIVFIVGIMSLQRCLLNLVIFIFCLILPIPLINFVVGKSNEFVDMMIGNKFTYWAMVQQESYSSLIDNSATSGDYDNYLRTLYVSNSMKNPNQGGQCVILKWQCPKKMASLMLTANDESSVTGLRNSFITSVINSTYSGEKYLTNENYYLYRSYIDISNFSRYIYAGITGKGIQNKTKSTWYSLDGSRVDAMGSNLRKIYSTMSSDYSNYRQAGYANYDTDGNTKTADVRLATHVFPAISSSMVTDAFVGGDVLKDSPKLSTTLGINTYFGLNQNLFDFSLPMFTVSSYNDSTVATDESGADEEAESGKELDFIEVLTAKHPELQSYFDKYKVKDDPDAVEKDMVGLTAYGLYSESVFYYFSWCLYDQGLTPDSYASTGYKDLLLGQDNGGYFYNNGEGKNGELKDFMDMKSLFSYVIPYLNRGNDVLRAWEDLYGVKIYSGVSTEEGHTSEYLSDDVLQQKYWNNLNLARMYECYSPWVDIMYDCRYAKPETITVLGDKRTVSNPLDPSTYPDDRPMIFSKSEMVDYGLTEGDLTTVEKKILKCNEEFQSAMFDLLNYHKFNDVTLNTSAAMLCTFIFNKNFSETGIFKENMEIYPQSFELTDFSYDAVLRFVLANSTGDNLSSKEDFYESIIKSSSLTTAIVMILVDFVSVYVMPGLKIIFVILLFFTAIFVVLTSIFKVNNEKNILIRTWEFLVRPMLLFFVVNIAVTYLVSKFMGVGNDSVTNTSSSSFKFGDPVTVMLALLVIDIASVIYYYKIIRSVWSNLKSMAKSTGGFVTSVIGGGLDMIAGAIAGTAVGSAVAGGSGGSGKGSSSGSSGNSRATSRTTKVEVVKESEEEYHEKRVSRVDVVKHNMDEGQNGEREKSGYSEKREREINEATREGERRLSQENSEARVKQGKTKVVNAKSEETNKN